MAYFDPFCPILTDLLFLDLILWWETKAIWKKLSILLDGKFPEFLFGKIRFSIGFHFLNLWAFAVSFPNGGSSMLFSKYKKSCLEGKQPQLPFASSWWRLYTSYKWKGLERKKLTHIWACHENRLGHSFKMSPLLIADRSPISLLWPTSGAGQP